MVSMSSNSILTTLEFKIGRSGGAQVTQEQLVWAKQSKPGRNRRDEIFFLKHPK